MRPANEEGAVIELIEGLPDEVVGLEAIGEVTSDDYSSTAFPAVEDALSRHKKISLLHVLGERFTGYEAGGGWADAKLGVLHALSWRRIGQVPMCGVSPSSGWSLRQAAGSALTSTTRSASAALASTACSDSSER